MIIPELVKKRAKVEDKPPPPEEERIQSSEEEYAPSSDDAEFPLDLEDPELIDYDVQHEQVPVYLVTRDEWGAVEPKGATELVHPLPDVLFIYTNSDTCNGWEDCVNFMKKQQTYDMEKLGLPDIQYNFYIAKDWTVYEGCGWNTMASKVPFYPRPEKILTICYIGRYEGEIYPSIQVRSVMDSLIDYGVYRGFIKEDFNNLPILI